MNRTEYKIERANFLVFYQIFSHMPKKEIYAYLAGLNTMCILIYIINYLITGTLVSYTFFYPFTILAIFFNILMTLLYALTCARIYGFSVLNSYRTLEKNWKINDTQFYNHFTRYWLSSYLIALFAAFFVQILLYFFSEKLFIFRDLFLMIFLMTIIVFPTYEEIKDIVKTEAHHFIAYCTWLLDHRACDPVHKQWQIKVSISLEKAYNQYSKDFKYIPFYTSSPSYTILKKLSEYIRSIHNDQLLNKLSDELYIISQIEDRNYLDISVHFDKLSEILH